ncbi:D-isomer specific 2-hydroxyacid dehydrogenase [Pedobacter cryoconitis]|uniref:D-isomer specific 2-hydroxyacid dehydrogenase n=1 Tax=Pedobacter cryoconitis TaxID=188932 RepID=A0A127V7S3_9SPHI|nr:NAD(P)-dependent oxidoreductase [Pedobacter cryoconitis]AMP97259.1 D-isomer specific 2-hydroxyacid dehydrogenase [Pedobacter cryoconitis]
MRFEKITIIDSCGLTQEIINQLTALSKNKISIYSDYPQDDDETLARIGDSDCVLVSWQTKITAEIIAQTSHLKYIGMCCSLYDEASANVNIIAAREKGIQVKGVKDYGDEGAVEFIFAQLIFLLKGLIKARWKDEPVELKNKSMGIIGLGTLGLMVAQTAQHFGMQVFYFSRSRKYEQEKNGITFLPLAELIASCDIISTHLPKNTVILTEREFKLKKPNSILVNTSLGVPFEKEAFLNWIADAKNFAIFDADGVGDFAEEFSGHDNIILSDQFGGFTFEAKQRLSEKVLTNITNYLNG